MTIGHSPAEPDELSRPATLVEKIAAVIVLVALVVGALTLVL